jgi:hypothetical protein
MTNTMLKDSRTAASNFHLTSQSWDAVPKLPFLYYIRFVRSTTSSAGSSRGVSSTGSSSSNSATSTDWSESIGVIAKEIDRPSVNFQTETLNQYNKKRVIQKKHEFDDISFTFYDTVDNKALHMFEDYYRFYYGEPNNESSTVWVWDNMANTMNQGTGGFGFIPASGTNNTHYFARIELYYLYGGKYSRYDIVNPKLKSMRPSGFSYAESDGAEINMSFEFEAVIYQGNNNSISSDAGFLQEMGLASSGFYEPVTTSNSASVSAGSKLYQTTAGTLDYGTYSNSNLTLTSGDATSGSGSRSSSTVTVGGTSNTIVNGTITKSTVGTTSAVSGSPVIGDNIAKKIVSSVKAIKELSN